jgi:hypothetical protein
MEEMEVELIRTKTGKRIHVLDPRCSDGGYRYPLHPLCGGGLSRVIYRENHVEHVSTNEVTCMRCQKILVLNGESNISFSRHEEVDESLYIQEDSLDSSIKALLVAHNPIMSIDVFYQLSEGSLILCRDRVVLARKSLGEWMIQGRYSFEDMKEEPTLLEDQLLLSHMTGTKRFGVTLDEQTQRFFTRLCRLTPKRQKYKSFVAKDDTKIDDGTSRRVSFTTTVLLALSLAFISFILLGMMFS